MNNLEHLALRWMQYVFYVGSDDTNPEMMLSQQDLISAVKTHDPAIEKVSFVELPDSTPGFVLVFTRNDGKMRHVRCDLSFTELTEGGAFS